MRDCSSAATSDDYRLLFDHRASADRSELDAHSRAGTLACVGWAWWWWIVERTTLLGRGRRFVSTVTFAFRHRQRRFRAWLQRHFLPLHGTPWLFLIAFTLQRLFAFMELRNALGRSATEADAGRMSPCAS
jgi:hypothetical protein